MGDSAPPADDPSLYFLSTQIQSRYEDQEHKDTKISSLQKFKNALAPVQAPQERRVKKKPKAKPKTNRKITSISGFVRETLGSKKLTDTQCILDYFAGDKDKMEQFLSRMESATSSQHILTSRSGQGSKLFSEKDWKAFVEKLGERIPGLSKQNKKSLRLISSRLERFKSQETASQKIWSQASRQPSDDLTTDDIKLLYDLEDGHQSSQSFAELESEIEARPSCFTLSQVLDDSVKTDPRSEETHRETQEASLGSNAILPSSPSKEKDHISDSEPEIEPLSRETIIYLISDRDTSSDDIPGFSNQKPSSVKDTSSHQRQASESVDVLTSFSFAPTIDKNTGSKMPLPRIPSTPTGRARNRDLFRTPTKVETIYVDSSPLSDKKRTQRQAQLGSKNGSQRSTTDISNATDSQSLNISPLKPRSKRAKKEALVCHGKLSLFQESLGNIVFKSNYAQSSENVVPDSEDDEGETRVEILRIEGDPGSKDGHSSPRNVLQVPSSPEYSLTR